MSNQCPICGNGISPFQTTKNITFQGQPVIAHYRCWFENQEALAQLEQNYPDAPLAESVRKLREGKL